MFFKALTRGFWVLYDNLLKSILLNLVMFAIIFIPMYFLWNAKFYIPAILMIGTLWHVFAMAVMNFFSKVIRGVERKGVWAEIWEGIKAFWWRGIAVFASVLVMAGLAYVSFVFYREHSKNMLALAAGGIAVWLTFMFLVMQIYMMPIIVLDEKKRFFSSMKKSLIMVLAKPFSSLFLMLVIMYFFMLFWPITLWIGGPHVGPIVYVTMFPVFLMPFLSLIFVIILQLNATILIFEKFNIEGYPDLKETWEDRDLNNLFRPWEVK